MEKSGKILENCHADLENADVYYAAFFNFLAVHDIKCMKFIVQKLESHSVFSQFCHVFVHINMKKCIEKFGKQSNFVPENHSQISVRTVIHAVCDCLSRVSAYRAAARRHNR